MTTLVIEFTKIKREDATKYTNFYSKSKAETIINESDIDDVFESVYTTIILNVQKYIGKGLGLIIDSVVDHTIDISKFNPLAGSSYIKLTKELDHIIKKIWLIFKISIIINALNGTWLDMYIRRIRKAKIICR